MYLFLACPWLLSSVVWMDVLQHSSLDGVRRERKWLAGYASVILPIIPFSLLLLPTANIRLAFWLTGRR
jgi:hypothetical protein